MAAAGLPLTPRQLDALRLAALGKRNGEIAALLGISPHTVADYLRQTYRRLGVRSRHAAVLKLVRDARG